MKTMIMKILVMAVLTAIMPQVTFAQGLGDKIYGLNSVLDKLFTEMLPLCSQLIDVGRAIAGFAALSYIAVRVWKHIAKAEAIDFFPLLRPFAIGMAIVLFPYVIGLMNGVLQPVVTATANMSKDSRKAILWDIEQQEKAIKETSPIDGMSGGSNGMEKYEQPGGSDEEPGLLSAFSMFSFKNAVKILIRDFFGILYAAASLCINTIRTFYLIILAMLGPLVFGLSVFDGFEQTLSSWFARYINVFMWLPVANIFGAINSKILENMFTLDQDFYSSTAYIVFMIISIVGYTTVPNVADYIIQAGGKDTLMHKVNSLAKTAGKAAVGSVL